MSRPDVRRRRVKAARLLPPAPGADRPLLLVIAVIMALACLAAVGARASFAAAGSWTADLEAAMTVQVAPSDGETAERAAVRAASTTRGLPGVANAAAIPQAEVEALLAPWFGASGLPDAAPLPGLVDVTLDPIAPARADDVALALAAAGFDAVVDDHAQWSSAVGRFATVLRAGALGLLALLVIAAAAVTSLAVKAALSARQDVVEALHLVGARDGFIAGEFTARFTALGLRAGLVAAVIAVGLAFAVQAAAGAAPPAAADFIPRFRLALFDIIIFAATPLASAFLAAATARGTVLQTLKSLY